MKTTRITKVTRWMSVLAAGLAAASLIATGLVTPAAMAREASQEAASGSEKDILIFRNGKQVEGTILEETPTEVRIRVNVAGIEAEVPYPKSDILQIVRGTGKPADDKSEGAGNSQPKAAPKAETAAAAPASSSGGVAKKKVYHIELKGVFGEDISQTPIRQAVKDAQRLGVDYIIVSLDNDWSMQGGLEERKDDDTAFDELFRSEDMDPIFNEEIPRDWEKPPQVIFWVKKAMGGAAFLPFNCPNIYFHSEGKMGGIGHLQAIFGGMGDEVVREKQFSLRLGHAEGKAIRGGYDPRIIRAMARDEYVLSYRIVGGKAELLERMPESADEFLLTDDGSEQEGRRDDIQALARGEGNDCLTLTADVAHKLGVSKGTVDTFEDLMFQLGISRNYELVKGQSKRIMESWSEGIENAKRQLPRLWREYQRVEVKAPGGYRERTQARSQRKQILTEMQQIEKRYEEALNPRRIPPGLPNWHDLETLKKQIDLEQLADKPERR